MTATDLNLDIEVLVGVLPEIPCEEPTHATSPLHGGPATQYARWMHGCVFPSGTVVALCEPIIARLSAQIAAGIHGHCRVCGCTKPIREFVQIIGPIGGAL